MKSEFLESELELYVQRLLIHESYSSGNRYRMLKISPSEERLKGYDAEVVGLTSFYCQFKTSDFLTQGSLYKKREEFCAKKSWPKSTFYTFALRVPNDPEDKKNPKSWQHNVLHTLWKNNPTGVAYVAPLFHTRTQLDLHEPIGELRCCLLGCERRSSSVAIQDVLVDGHEKCRLPSFDGLISIPPHSMVSDLKHSYCFNSPRDVSFHSEPELVEGGNTFGSALRSFVENSKESFRHEGAPARMTISGVRKLIGADEDDASFLDSFVTYGLIQAGILVGAMPGGAATYFENEVPWLQQRIAFSAALSAYFGISTLALMKFQRK